MIDQQQAEELQVFQIFTQVCPLAVAPDSIEARRPDEPDIRCEVTDEGPVTFELVEIIDEQYCRRLSEQVGMLEFIERTHAALPVAQLHSLDERFRNALVSIAFEVAATSRQRRKALPDLLRLLTTVEPRFVGKVLLTDEPDLAEIISHVRISRGDFVGPCFDVENVGWLGNPLLDRIRDKFAKTYTTDAPIELLAYYHWQPMGPTEIWLRTCGALVAEGLAGSPFRRVWVFDVRRKGIEFVWPTVL
jgi:hypothetical protein